MSNYQIGKDIEALRQRVQELEQIVEDLVEFELAESQSEDLPQAVEALGELPGPGLVAAPRTLKLTWGRSTSHAMEYRESTLLLRDNGTWQSTCVLEDRSRHSKWGNRVQFWVQSKDPLTTFIPLGSWSGDFGPGEVKTYGRSGSSASLKAHFDKLWKGELQAWRKWECWRR